jgi:hypothetical protein
VTNESGYGSGRLNKIPILRIQMQIRIRNTDNLFEKLKDHRLKVIMCTQRKLRFVPNKILGKTFFLINENFNTMSKEKFATKNSKE